MLLFLEPEAVIEAQEQYQWYEEKETGVGESFYAELATCVEEILDDPQRQRLLHRGLRKWKLRSFPILVFYRTAADAVRIVSVFHGARHPSRWQRRT